MSFVTRIRAPAVAGRFYPATRPELIESLSRLLDHQHDNEQELCARPVAMIVPHAGYRYSGKVAAAAFRRLRPFAKEITRVAMFAPAHRMPVRGLATVSATAFATPLGDVRIDQAALEELCQRPDVQRLDEAHRDEHAIEVQLPFLQAILPAFTLLPFVVGQATDTQVAEVMTNLLAPGTLVVVSSDLSHFHTDEAAQRLDSATTAAIEALDPDGLGRESACGRIAIRALLLLARERGWKPQTISVQNSAAAGGSPERVVGYGSYLFLPPSLPTSF